MAESAYLGTRGAEISERSTELVLPGTSSAETRGPVRERKIGVNEPEATIGRESDGRRSAASDAATAGRTPNTIPETALGKSREAGTPPQQRGLALPGDRGRESRSDTNQRPSFWRRIALGRRGTRTRDETQLMNQANTSSPSSPSSPTSPTSMGTLARPSRPQTADSIEKRIVEPMLQALVSVESKLERSHVDLVGRSEQV